MTFLEFRCRYFFDLKKKMFKHSAIHFLSIYSMAAVAAILYMRIALAGFPEYKEARRFVRCLLRVPIIFFFAPLLIILI